MKQKKGQTPEEKERDAFRKRLDALMKGVREHLFSPDTKLLQTLSMPGVVQRHSFACRWDAATAYYKPRRDELAAVPICEEHPADVSKMTSEASTSALDEQVGGDHYRKMAIQPIEYIVKNRLGFIEGNIVKYATRHRDKNGAEDVKKIIHYARMLLEMAYGEKG